MTRGIIAEIAGSNGIVAKFITTNGGKDAVVKHYQKHCHLGFVVCRGFIHFLGIVVLRSQGFLPVTNIYYMSALNKHVQEMLSLSKHLLKYSFPLTPPEDEDIISILKQREIEVDGYELVVYLNRCRYSDVELETLQVYGKYFTFLPFALVCKVANAFLGDKELSLIEVMHHRQGNVMDEYSRKIYVWSVYYNADGEKITSPFVNQLTPCSYDGLHYSHVNREQITFF